jgi:hypothetical protein
MDNVGVVVDDLAGATAFVELGMELEVEAPVEGEWVDASSGSTMSESTSQCCGHRTATAGLS